MDVLEQTIEQGNDVDSPDFIFLLSCDFERLLTELESHIECRNSLALGVWESGLLEVLRLFVHQVDDKGKGAVEMVVKDSTILHDRLENKLEEIPHALSSSLLVVDKLTEARETLVCALSSKIIQSSQDWLL